MTASSRRWRKRRSAARTAATSTCTCSRPRRSRSSTLPSSRATSARRAKRSADESELLGTPGGQGAHILIIEAPYYEAISAELAAGAIAELDAARATYERIVVPGALEIPQALAQAVKADLIGSDD